MKTTKEEKLKKIADKYSEIEHSTNNFEIGGGLTGEKFESNRHSDAKQDSGKLTLGEATALFKKATGESVKELKQMIIQNFTNLEWHHAGKLPKSYGGGMKKTYFVNSHQIAEFALNFEQIKVNYKDKISEEKKEKLKTKDLQQVIFLELENKGEFFEREEPEPEFSIILKQEMDGKFGWFNSEHKSYNLTEYFTGYKFKTKKALKKLEEYIESLGISRFDLKHLKKALVKNKAETTFVDC